MNNQAPEIPQTLAEASLVLAGMTLAKMRRDYAGYEVLREQFGDTPEGYKALACAHQDLLRRVLGHLQNPYSLLQHVSQDDLTAGRR
jgi:hypothetical protein